MQAVVSTRREGWAMSRARRRNLKVALLAGAAAAIAFAVVRLRRTRELAIQTAGDIEAQIDALDPVAKAAVVAKLSADAARDVKARRS
jgi:predicted mannosyl-3-phosphoglycerate phosphatase (HAD superfamily)